MQIIQSWASGGAGTRSDPNEIGVTTIGTKVADLTDAMTVRDTMPGIQVIVVVGGGTTEMIEVGTDGIARQGRGPQGDRDPGIGITEDGGRPRRE